PGRPGPASGRAGSSFLAPRAADRGVDPSERSAATWPLAARLRTARVSRRPRARSHCRRNAVASLSDRGGRRIVAAPCASGAAGGVGGSRQDDRAGQVPRPFALGGVERIARQCEHTGRCLRGGDRSALSRWRRGGGTALRRAALGAEARGGGRAAARSQDGASGMGPGARLAASRISHGRNRRSLAPPALHGQRQRRRARAGDRLGLLETGRRDGGGGRRPRGARRRPMSDPSRCGYIALVGAPNAGKSTLLIFVDTPGIFAPRRRLDRAMVAAAWAGVEDADLVVVLIDAARGLDDGSRAILDRLTEARRSFLIALNKIDLVKREVLLPLTESLRTAYRIERLFMISSTLGDGTDDLLDHLAGAVPEGPWLFPEDQLTDLPQRMLAAEATRE